MNNAYSPTTMISRITLLATLAVLLLGAPTAMGQSMSVYNVNTSAFPTITADYAAFDANGEPMTGLTAADFRVQERANGGPFIDVTPTLKHDCDTKSEDPEATILIILDRSNSMWDEVGGKTRFQWAKDAINAFVQKIKFVGETRVCLVSFSGNYEVKVDWTNDPKIIRDTLLKMEPVGATDYEIPFNSPGNNIYEKFKERPANIAKYAFFLTDGHPNPGIDDEYDFVQTNTDNLTAQGIRFYSITLLVPTTHWTLEALSAATGGKSVVTSETELVDLFSLLALETQNTESCTLTWTAPYGCHPDDRNRTATITLLKAAQPTQTIYYVTPANSVASVKISDPVLFCGDPLANQTSTAVVTITAQNAPLKVTRYSITPNTYFTVLDSDTTIPGNQKDSVFTLQPGQSRHIRVEFKQGAQRIYRQAELRFEGSPCPPIIDLVGGQGVVKISAPNGGELFSTCDTVTITWSGVLPTQPVRLEYSSDNGNTWNLITLDATGLAYKWLPPNAGTQYMVRAKVATIAHYQWAAGFGGTGTETATAVAVNHNDLDIYTTGYVDGPTKIGTTVVNNELGNIDGYLVKWTADGNIVKTSILKGTGNNDDRVMGVVADTFGNYYVVGYFTSPSIQFGTLSPRTIGAGDASNMFVYAFDQNDNLKWSAFGTGSGLNTTTATGTNIGIRYNASGRPEIFVVGTFQRFIRVGYNAGGSPEESNRYTDNTNRKYYVIYDETNGAARLFENAVPPADVVLNSLKDTDSKGFEYETGDYTGSKTFSPPTITIPGYGGKDQFLSKFGSIPPSEDESDDVFIVKAPQLEFSVSNASMDPTAQGQFSSKSFNGILCNTGDFPVVVKSYSFGGPHPTEFTLISNITDVRIAPGECLSIEVEFTPAGMGMRTTQLTVVGDCGEPAVLLLDGEGLAPCWYDNVSNYDLGKIPMGTNPSFQIPCVIKNTGPTNLAGTLTGSGSTDIVITSGAGPFTLAPNECLDVEVTVNPTTPGNISIVLDYGLGQDCGSPITVVTATILQPNVSISSVDFGRKRLCTTSSDTVQISNLNPDPVVITSLTMSDPSDPNITVDLPGTPFTLNQFETRDIPVTFAPTVRGTHSVTITAAVQGQSEPLIGEVTGIGYLPAIKAEGYTFAAWTVGQLSPETGFIVITNTDADADLQVFDIRFATPSADFAWVTPPAIPLRMSPGRSDTLYVTFTPQADGNRRVDVIIDHDAVCAPSAPYTTDTTVVVQGVGAEPSDIPPVNYGDVLTCATKAVTVRIINPNPTAALNCSAPAGSGDLTAFTLSETGAFVVPAGGTLDITATFIPPGVGNFSATFNIPNDQGLSLNINLSGVGVTTTADFVFGNVVSGIVGEPLRTPVDVTVGDLDTVTVSRIVFTFTHSADFIAFKQFTTPQQAGWNLVPDVSTRGITVITATPDPGVQLQSGAFMTPEFDVYLTADASLPITFDAVVEPGCIIPSGDDDDLAVQRVCFAEGRLVKIGGVPFSMQPPSPNPMGAMATVNYSTGIDVSTTFELVDLVGNVVKTITTPVQSSGTYTLDLETGDVANGLYMLRMVSGPYAATQQVMIVK